MKHCADTFFLVMRFLGVVEPCSLRTSLSRAEDSIETQKSNIFILITAVRTSNPTLLVVADTCKERLEISDDAGKHDDDA